jgi:hypothetical protein
MESQDSDGTPIAVFNCEDLLGQLEEILVPTMPINDDTDSSSEVRPLQASIPSA